MKHFSFYLLVCLGLVSASTNAAVVYSYIGNNYDNIVAGTAFNTDMHITGSFELSDRLAPNLGFTTISPTVFSFSNGVETFSNTIPLRSSFFAVSTDSTGDIIDWVVTIEGEYPAPPAPGDTQGTILLSPSLDQGIIYECNSFAAQPPGACSSGGVTDLAEANQGGTWSVSTVPVPAAAWLFGSGLLGLLGIARRKKAA